MLRLGVKESSHVAARLIDDLPGCTTFGMHGRGIGGIKRIKYRLPRCGKQRRSSVIIEIDAPSRHAFHGLAPQLVVTALNFLEF